MWALETNVVIALTPGFTTHINRIKFYELHAKTHKMLLFHADYIIS